MVEVPTNTCSIRGRYVPNPCIALHLVVASQIRSTEMANINKEVYITTTSFMHIVYKAMYVQNHTKTVTRKY